RGAGYDPASRGIESELRKRNSNSGASAGMEFRKRNSKRHNSRKRELCAPAQARVLKLATTKMHHVRACVVPGIPSFHSPNKDDDS
ncbi:hypothetical protein, partial [Streptomyces zaomyceticus]|uniref:hypothetical protein n=1 Tax=Streptomyces zaomyceticus TaxID=68286 RepID=UPI0037BC649C